VSQRVDSNTTRTEDEGGGYTALSVVARSSPPWPRSVVLPTPRPRHPPLRRDSNFKSIEKHGKGGEEKRKRNRRWGGKR
jgi:hypothetical protein